jgi:hypothetical protein
MPKIIFSADYDHRWPSRAITAYKAGWSGTVKREVSDAAIAKGKATEVERSAKVPSDGEASRRQHSGPMDGRDTDARRINASRIELADHDDVGGSDGISVVPGTGQ